MFALRCTLRISSQIWVFLLKAVRHHLWSHMHVKYTTVLLSGFFFIYLYWDCFIHTCDPDSNSEITINRHFIVWLRLSLSSVLSEAVFLELDLCHYCHYFQALPVDILGHVFKNILWWIVGAQKTFSRLSFPLRYGCFCLFGHMRAVWVCHATAGDV